MCLKGYVNAGDGKNKKINDRHNSLTGVGGWGSLHYFLKLSLEISVSWELLNTGKRVINGDMQQQTEFLQANSLQSFCLILLHSSD